MFNVTRLCPSGAKIVPNPTPGVLDSLVVSGQPYRQTLAELELSIERFTEHVPSDGSWYLIRAGELVGRFRSLSAAQEAWRKIVRESGWQPRPIDVDPADVRRREQAERWSRNRGVSEVMQSTEEG
jgi:hypothetical protein